jgi:hypothetical protein
MKSPHRLSVLLLLSTFAAACGDGAVRQPERVEAIDLSAPAPVDAQTATPQVGEPSADPLSRPGVDPAGAGDTSAARATESKAGAPMLIRSGVASVQVDSLEEALARVRAVARTLGGYVAGSSLQGGRDEARQATLELKVPSARWDQAVAALGRVGKVESVNVQAQDVGEAFVDVQAREANARRLEERLLRLLDTRTGRLNEVLKVERELARVRAEIERYDGRLRYLAARVAVSSLTVRLHEPLPVVGDHPGASVLGDALQDAWRNFMGFLTGLIAALGYLVPGAAAAYLVWRLVRRAAGRLWRARPEAAGPTRLVIRRPKRPNLKVE